MDKDGRRDRYSDRGRERDRDKTKGREREKIWKEIGIRTGTEVGTETEYVQE
jgi:hypothetical protein